jgi:hypothetical protein
MSGERSNEVHHVHVRDFRARRATVSVAIVVHLIWSPAAQVTAGFFTSWMLSS